MIIPNQKPLFRKDGSQNRGYRIVALIVLILCLLFVLRGVNTGSIQPFFMPTLTPTRTFSSYAAEGETNFIAGDLNSAIAAYQQALKIDPNNSNLWAEMARIQVYSSRLLTTDQTKYDRINEALASVDKAIQADTESSTAYAVKCFALDWLSSSALVSDTRQSLLAQAEQAAVKALQLDNQNTLALAYYAEVLMDEQKWQQADQNIKEAIQRDPTLMDVHRINGVVQESLGNYSVAIAEYQKAVAITPNMTFLYMSIGVNYRSLKQYELALENFDKAAKINETLGINDPMPYTSIANTYVQMGQFAIASLNARKALSYQPGNPDSYGQLGIEYYKGKNYEGAVLALKCAIKGCTAQESCDVRQCNSATDPMVAIQGLPLTDNTAPYYFTYGSDLAALHTTGNGYCQEAMQVLEQVRQGFPTDDTILQIVNESEAICHSYGY